MDVRAGAGCLAVPVLGSSVDWTQVLVALIAGLPAILSAFFAFRIRRAIQTPSGDPIGHVAERSHDLISADLALTTQVHGAITNGAADAGPGAHG